MRAAVVRASWLRLVVSLFVHAFYRIGPRGLDHIPRTGAAVLVCNHVSFIDALVVAAACRRPARFVVDHRIYALPGLNLVFRAGRAIPIAPAKEDPAMLDRALDEVARALDDGDLVCIFPEGRITATGEMGAFRPGIERIVQRNPVPVVPIALRGLWGSFFSRQGGGAMRRPFRRFWSRVEIVVGEPWPAGAVSASKLGAAVLALRGDAR